MFNEYDWFFAEVEAQGGVMSTDFATLNYVTIEELTELEDRGMIVRKVATNGETDIICMLPGY